jgi:4-amino-4-deoxy-L-arabinose transferase-like glycosyltransferase
MARIALLALFVMTAFLVLYRLGATPVERTSEKRCHEVAVTMLESGDFVVPWYDGEPRLQKPPAYYWLAAASGALFGGPNGFTTRLPSALATLLTFLLVARFAYELRGGGFAALAAGAFATMQQVSSSGRRGDAETTLMLGTVAALYAFHRLRSAPTPRWKLAFAAACALAVLAKATVALVTVALPIAVFLACEGALRSRLAGLALRLFLLATLPALGWYAMLILRVDGAFEALLGDLVLPVGVDGGASDDASHYRAPWYFADKILSTAIPASLLLPLVIGRAIRSRAHRDDPGMRFVLLAATAAFVAFSLIPQKQRHYLLPILPLLALLCADAATALLVRPAAIAARVARATALVLAGVGIAAALGLTIYFQALEPASRLPRFVLTPLIAATFVAGGVLAWRHRLGSAALAIALAALGGNALYQGHVQVFEARLDAALENDEPVAGEDHLLAVAKAKPWLIDAIDADDHVEDLLERRAAPAAR